MWVNSPVFRCLPIACHNSDAYFTTLPQPISCMYHSLSMYVSLTTLSTHGIATTYVCCYSINSNTGSCIIVHFGQLHYTNCYHNKDSPLTALVIDYNQCSLNWFDHGGNHC